VSVVTKNRCKRLNHLDQNGMLEGVWFANARRVVTNQPAWSRQLTVLPSVQAECGKSYTAFSRGNVGSRDAKMLASGQDVGGGIVAKRYPVMG
jgi:hypothetical protein